VAENNTNVKVTLAMLTPFGTNKKKQSSNGNESENYTGAI
jgi:hypothetical protein